MKNYKDLNDYEVMYMIGEKSDDATNLLFEKYKPIIEKYANIYYKYGEHFGLEYQDFIQEGYLGLNTAINNYTDNKSMFYTYAMICIKSKMGNLIKYNSTKKNYALNNSVSLYSVMENTDRALIECFKDDNAILPDIEMENSEIISALKKFIYSLEIEKASVLELKYNGFNNREIAKLLNMSTGKVSYILLFIRKKLNYYR